MVTSVKGIKRAVNEQILKEPKGENLLKKDPLRNEISFDGFKFWLRDEPIGQICKEYQCHSPIPKNVMDNYKQMFIDKIVNFGDVI